MMSISLLSMAWWQDVASVPLLHSEVCPARVLVCGRMNLGCFAFDWHGCRLMYSRQEGPVCRLRLTSCHLFVSPQKPRPAVAKMWKPQAKPGIMSCVRRRPCQAWLGPRAAHHLRVHALRSVARRPRCYGSRCHHQRAVVVIGRGRQALGAGQVGFRVHATILTVLRNLGVQ